MLRDQQFLGKLFELASSLSLAEFFMPQPLKRPTSLDQSPTAIQTHPELAALIVEISIRWNAIEQGLSMLLSFLIGADRQLGIAIYFSAASLPLRLELLKSVARLKAPDDKLSAIEDLTDEVRKRSRERNKVIHCGWATSPEYPDALIRTDSAEYLKAWTSAYEEVAEKLATKSPEVPIPDGLLVSVKDGAEIYREDDFNDVIERLEKLFRHVCTFMIVWADDAAAKTSRQSDSQKE